MVKYAAFLRGINIGSRKVTMQELQRVFKSLGLNNAKTFIASGNVIFETDDSAPVSLTRVIEQKLKAQFGFAIATMLRKIEYLLALRITPPLLRHSAQHRMQNAAVAEVFYFHRGINAASCGEFNLSAIFFYGNNFYILPWG